MKPSTYSPKYDKLRAWLKSQREKGGWTIREVAEKYGRHPSIIGKLEQNSRRIDILEFVEYCHVLGVDPHEGLDILMSRTPKPKIKQ